MTTAQTQHMLTPARLMDICYGTDFEIFPEHRISAFYREYPWLSQHLPTDSIKRAYAQSAKAELLDLGPDFCYGRNYWDRCRLFLVKGDGKIASFKRYATETVTKRRWLIGKPYTKEISRLIKSFDGEIIDGSILNALDYLGEWADQVYFVVSYFQETVIIYSVPGKHPFGEWYRNIMANEQALFRLP